MRRKKEEEGEVDARFHTPNFLLSQTIFFLSRRFPRGLLICLAFHEPPTSKKDLVLFSSPLHPKTENTLHVATHMRREMETRAGGLTRLISSRFYMILVEISFSATGRQAIHYDLAAFFLCLDLGLLFVDGWTCFTMIATQPDNYD